VSASIPPPPAELEAVATKVEALMRVSNWQGVLETLDVLGADSGLPFTLKLARAMAQRELEVHAPPPRSKRWIGALALGLFLGIALSAALGPWLGSLFGK
jgi:cytochrome c biogenesis protein CcdA